MRVPLVTVAGKFSIFQQDSAYPHSVRPHCLVSQLLEQPPPEFISPQQTALPQSNRTVFPLIIGFVLVF